MINIPVTGHSAWDIALTLANPLEDFLSQVRRRCIVDDKYPNAWPLNRT
jgi:hypothetical protein